MADEIHTVVYSDWRAEPKFARLAQGGYAGCAVTFEDMRPMAETAARIALLEADNARLRQEAVEWTEMLARDGIRFDDLAATAIAKDAYINHRLLVGSVAEVADAHAAAVQKRRDWLRRTNAALLLYLGFCAGVGATLAAFYFL